MFDFFEDTSEYNSSDLQKKVIAETFKRVNAHPKTFITEKQIRRTLVVWGLIIRFYAATLLYMPFNSKKKDYFKDGFIRIPNLGFIRITPDKLFHNMYLNGYFTEAEWLYIRDERYSRMFKRYFEKLNDKQWKQNEKLHRQKINLIVSQMKRLSKIKVTPQMEYRKIKESRAFQEFLKLQK